MKSFTRCRWLSPLAVVVLGWAGGAASGADQATVRGQIDTVDPATRTVTVRTAAGDALTLTADAKTRLSVGGKPTPLDEFRPGQRVRATFEKAGSANRLVALRTVVPTDADLSRDIREAVRTAGGFTAAQKEKYEEKMRDVIDDVDDRLDDLQARAADATADARAKLAPRIEELKRTRDEFEKRLDRAKPAAADAWENLKTGVGAAADDLQRALDRFRDDPKPKSK